MVRFAPTTDRCLPGFRDPGGVQRTLWLSATHPHCQGENPGTQCRSPLRHGPGAGACRCPQRRPCLGKGGVGRVLCQGHSCQGPRLVIGGTPGFCASDGTSTLEGLDPRVGHLVAMTTEKGSVTQRLLSSPASQAHGSASCYGMDCALCASASPLGGQCPLSAPR